MYVAQEFLLQQTPIIFSLVSSFFFHFVSLVHALNSYRSAVSFLISFIFGVVFICSIIFAFSSIIMIAVIFLDVAL